MKGRTSMIESLLIANRGEIARRIIRTAPGKVLRNRRRPQLLVFDLRADLNIRIHDSLKGASTASEQL